MSIGAMERIATQIKMNLQDSSQRNHEALQKSSERRLKKPSYKCSKCCDTGWILIPQKKVSHLQLGVSVETLRR